MIIKHTTKTLSLLALITLTTACSSSRVISSLPGSQLIGQQKEDKKVATAVSKAAKTPDVNTDDSAPMRKTILKALPVVAKTNTNTGTASTSAFGVKASEPKMKAAAPVAAKIAQAPVKAPTTVAKVATTPKPAMAKVVTTSKPTIVSQDTTRRLTLNGSATFRTGSSKLSNDGKQKLASLARSLSAPNTKISRLLIEGHTDSAGSAAGNQVLSLKRANAVADYLAEQGLMRSSMETVGLGEGSPIADNKTKAGRAQNRRVEITATGSRQTTR